MSALGVIADPQARSMNEKCAAPRMTASPPRPVPPLVRALMDVREILERAHRTGDRREIEAAIERIKPALDEPE